MKKFIIPILILMPCISSAGTTITSQDVNKQLTFPSTITVTAKDSNGYSINLASGIIAATIKLGDGTVLTSTNGLGGSSSTQTFVDTTSSQTIQDGGSKTWLNVSTFTGTVYGIFSSSYAAPNGMCVSATCDTTTTDNTLPNTCLNGSKITFTTNGNPTFIEFSAAVSNNTAGDGVAVYVLIDGVGYPMIYQETEVAGITSHSRSVSYFGRPVSFRNGGNPQAISTLTPGSHTFCLGWTAVAGGTASIWSVSQDNRIPGVVFGVMNFP